MTVKLYQQPIEAVPPIEEARAMLPAHLRDRYWEPCLMIFLAVPRLRPFIESYFDFDKEMIDIPWFNQAVLPSLSHGEQFMATLAFHLFNADNPLPDDGLAGLRLLDSRHFLLAIAAIRRASQR